MDENVKGILAVILFFLLTLFCVIPVPVMAATENDLREVMGLERIEGEDWESAAKRILKECATAKDYNELLESLSDIPDEESMRLAEENEKISSYYTEYIKKFKDGDPAEELTELLSSYNSLYESLYSSVSDTLSSTDPEAYDEDFIKSRITYANTLLNLCKSTKDIGIIGGDADTFLKRNLRIKNISRDSLTCYVTKGDKVYSQLKGVVTSVENNTVVVKSGLATIITYTGVKADDGIKKGTSLKQYGFIGRAKGSSVTVQFTSGVTSENLLKMYGGRADKWLEEYLDTAPWEKSSIDLSDIKDEIEKKEDETSGKTVMTDTEGNETVIDIEGNTYDASDETVLDKDVESYIFGDK